MPIVVLGLGSNKGDSRRIILDAVKALEEILTELRCASLYETEPLYVNDQGRFINTAVTGFYKGPLDSSSARELLSKINKIEARFGRNRSQERRWGERYLDIDILLFGDLVLKEPGLEIPHPRLKERRFALEPLLELLPELVEPGTGLSYREICNSLPEQGVRL
jgi:2-amino-4-hydroxy-6-hydroxymethyldihydropteridine diphosphokinase